MHFQSLCSEGIFYGRNISCNCSRNITASHLVHNPHVQYVLVYIPEAMPFFLMLIKQLSHFYRYIKFPYNLGSQAI